MKTVILFGNFTFNGFTPEELEMFKTDLEAKALVHRVDLVLVVSDRDVDKTIERLENEYESWLVPTEFEGEIVCDPESLWNDNESNITE